MNFSISSILLRGCSTSYLFLDFRFLDFNFQISICYDAYCFWIVFYKWERILEYLEWKLRSIVYMHFFFCSRWKTVPVSVARMRMAIRQKRRINSSLSKAYWRETLQVCRVRAFLRQERSPRPSHETASSEAARQVTVPLFRDSVSVFVFVEWLLERAPPWPRRSPSAFFNRTSNKLTNFLHLLINNLSIKSFEIILCIVYFFLIRLHRINSIEFFRRANYHFVRVNREKSIDSKLIM